MKATLAIVSTLAVVLGLARPRAADRSSPGADPSATCLARRDALDVVVSESGYLKAQSSQRLSPEFRGEAAIRWLIDEGSRVQAGDVLVEFDPAPVEQQLEDARAALIRAEIDLDAARADLDIQQRDGGASVDKAGLTLELARLALERYEEGEAPNASRKLRLEVEKAESAHTRAAERYGQVPELERQGFLTRIQAEEEHIRLREAEIQREGAREELKLFETYTFRMERTGLASAVADAERELENVRAKSEIALREKEARVAQEERHLELARKKVTSLEIELGRMRILAPGPGTVHYGDPSRPWLEDDIRVGGVLHAGVPVITLPDLSRMQVVVELHQADIDRVAPGQPVRVVPESHPGITLAGTVGEVAEVASSESWEGGESRTFRVEIVLEPTELPLRAGVTARVEIQVDRAASALLVPIQSVFGEGGAFHAFVGPRAERRPLEVGRSSDSHVEVLDGLKEGESVWLFDPTRVSGPGSEEE